MQFLFLLAVAITFVFGRKSFQYQRLVSGGYSFKFLFFFFFLLFFGYAFQPRIIRNSTLHWITYNRYKYIPIPSSLSSIIFASHYIFSNNKTVCISFSVIAEKALNSTKQSYSQLTFLFFFTSATNYCYYQKKKKSCTDGNTWW